jgi:NCAIR mutase (PurE)-related protein
VNRDGVLRLLERVASGTSSPRAALDELSWLPIEELRANGADDDAFARLDHHRALRNGLPEVVYCPGKTTEQIVDICARLAVRPSGFLATRADDATRVGLAERFPEAAVNDLARTVHMSDADVESAGERPVLIATGGTADLPVAEEAAVTASAFGAVVERLYDVGVAGLHRLLANSDALRRAGVIIAVAGMEGALPSVIAGLVRTPVIAVPTSTGYGASFGGVAALLAMLNSCAAGVTVVNIDNGFGAACAATRINSLSVRVS